MQRNEIYIYLRFQRFIYMKDEVYKDDVVHILLSVVQFLNNFEADFNAISTTIPYTSGSITGLVSSRYIFPFQNSGPFSDVVT